MKRPVTDAIGIPPLAAASARLRRAPGRQRSASTPKRAEPLQGSAPPSARTNSRPSETGVPALCPVTPRLLDLGTAAAYLSVSPWTVRDLEAAGVLPRVRVPVGDGGELRKLLFDREDLDHLINRWKDRTATGA
jgi:hypothetical protein